MDALEALGAAQAFDALGALGVAAAPEEDDPPFAFAVVGHRVPWAGTLQGIASLVA